MNSSLKGRKVLVVGATGFIGSNLVEGLVKEKAIVNILIRKKDDLKFFGKLPIKYFLGDLVNYKSLLNATKDIDIIFNTSGALPYHKLTKKEYWNINVTGIENLMKAGFKNKVKRVVHISTVGIYGEVADNIDEKSLPNPKGIYAESKLAGDKIVKKYYKKGLPVVIIRPTTAYGPGDTRPVILSLLKLVKYRILFVIDNGKNYFHTVYISNLVDGIILASINKKAIGEDFIIGDEPCPTFLSLSNSINDALGSKAIKINLPKKVAYLFFGSFIKGKLDFVTSKKRYKIDKAKRLLGFKPKVNLRNGIQMTLEWYKENNLI